MVGRHAHAADVVQRCGGPGVEAQRRDSDGAARERVARVHELDGLARAVPHHDVRPRSEAAAAAAAAVGPSLLVLLEVVAFVFNERLLFGARDQQQHRRFGRLERE